ncbi:MAG: YvrJ family protein [Halanaerobiales bacterium]
MEDMLSMAGSYGFPMVMAVYLLVRIEPIIRSLKESVDSLFLLIAFQGEFNIKDSENVEEYLKENKIQKSV